MSKRGPGRPLAFDRTAALDAVMRLFWRHGYDGASMPDIAAATGLSTSSLYNTYGSKQDLLVAALTHYHETVLERFMLGPLRDGERGREDVGAFLDRLEAALEHAPTRGCLAVNTLAEFRDPPPPVAELTARYRATLRAALQAALTRAETRGELPPGTAAARTDTLVPLVLAYNLLVAARAPATESLDILRAARALATP